MEIQPRRFLPDTRDIEKKDPEGRYAFILKQDVDVYKNFGWSVYSDHRKEAKNPEGKIPDDTTIQTHDMIYMVVKGKSKDKWERERVELVDEQKRQIRERHKDLDKEGAFQGKIEIT